MQKPTILQRAYRRSKPWLRVQLCATAMGCVLLAGSVGYAAHRAQDSARKLGSEILSNVEPMSGAASIEFNGAHFMASTKLMPLPVKDVLNQAEALCRNEGGDLQAAFGPIASKVSLRSLTDPAHLMTLRNDTSQASEIGCWVRRNGGRSIMDRVRAFVSTGDMSQFGSLQYVRAERVGDQTLVRVVWSEGSLALDSMFPSDGDTPGKDLQNVPRPPHSARILSATVQGSERHVVGYQTSDTPQSVAQFYTAQLAPLGWKEVRASAGQSNDPNGEDGLLSRFYERDGEKALLGLRGDGDGTSVTWVQLSQRD